MYSPNIPITLIEYQREKIDQLLRGQCPWETNSNKAALALKKSLPQETYCAQCKT